MSKKSIITWEPQRELNLFIGKFNCVPNNTIYHVFIENIGGKFYGWFRYGLTWNGKKIRNPSDTKEEMINKMEKILLSLSSAFVSKKINELETEIDATNDWYTSQYEILKNNGCLSKGYNNGS